MSRQKPVLMNTDPRMEREQYEHPAFGCVEVTQTSARGMTLFMSNVKHDHVMRFAVRTAELHRGFHHDQHFSNHHSIVEFYMTMTQFAEMMGGLGKSSGVPCTLRSVGRELMPDIDTEPTTKRFAAEARAEFKELAKGIQEVINDTEKELDAAKVSKARQKTIIAPLVMLQRRLTDRLPFMQDMFVESLEGIASEAKAVIEAYAMERGLDASEAPKMIGGDE